jgi:hypothetical protein
MFILETGDAEAAQHLIEEGANRREHLRVEHPPLGVSGPRATVQNISLGGICLVLDTVAQRGDRFDLHLTDALSPAAQAMQGEVVWCKRGRAGLRWINQSPMQFLWLCERLNFWWSRGERFSVRINEIYSDREPAAAGR